MSFSLRKIAYFLWRLRAKVFLDFPLPCRLPFGSWYLAYADGMGFMFFFKRPYEENEWRFAQKFLKPGMTFFDVGANQGFYTLLAATQVGESGRVVSFEPVPSQMKKLQKNINLNRAGNVILEPVALGAKAASTTMHVCLEGDEALSSLNEPSKDAKLQKGAITVSVITLDSYVQKSGISSLDFAKIDVEGGELDVLKGGLETIKKMRPVFMCEVQNIRTRQWGYEASEICEFLEQQGYAWFEVVEGGLLRSCDIKRVGETKGSNLIAGPREKINLITGFLEK